MYDWIEENYGDDAGEEGSETWDEAVKAFEEYCEQSARQDFEDYLQSEYEYYLYLTLREAIDIFTNDIEELRAMLFYSGRTTINVTQYKMIIAHAVTILEVYLESITKTLITSNNQYLRNTIKNVKPFCDTAIKLGEIPLEEDGIKKYVLRKLTESLFHDIPKAVKTLEGVLDRKIRVDLAEICRATSIRHDIVHRNGKNKDGEQIDISRDLVESTLDSIEGFIHELDKHL